MMVLDDKKWTNLPITHAIRDRMLRVRKHPELDKETARSYGNLITALLDEVFPEIT